MGHGVGVTNEGDRSARRVTVRKPAKNTLEQHPHEVGRGSLQKPLCSANTTSVRRLGGRQVFVWQSGVIKPARRHTGAMPRRRRSWSSMIRRLLVDVVTLAGFAVTSRSQLAAENLFLRKQLALYQERSVKPRRPDPATRLVLVLLSRLLDWRALLTVVQPDTLIRWHRQGWRLLWRRKSRPGRPPIPR